MEFNQKLQELRKQKGLTQEELAKELYVSRTAISKWESGRGTPSIASLKTIAEFFSLTVDALLSPDEILSVAEEEGKRNERRTRDIVFGLLDISALLFLFLPLFAQRSNREVWEASLLSLESGYLKIFCLVLISGIVFFGVLTLVMQNCQGMIWGKIKTKISLVLGAIALLLFVISLHPYAAVVAFVFLAIKSLLLIKRS